MVRFFVTNNHEDSLAFIEECLVRHNEILYGNNLFNTIAEPLQKLYGEGFTSPNTYASLIKFIRDHDDAGPNFVPSKDLKFPYQFKLANKYDEEMDAKVISDLNIPSLQPLLAWKTSIGDTRQAWMFSGFTSNKKLKLSNDCFNFMLAKQLLIPAYLKQPNHTGTCCCFTTRPDGTNVHKDITDDPEHYLACKQYSREYIERHNKIVSETKNFLQYAFKIGDRDEAEGEDMEVEDDVAQNEDARLRQYALTNIKEEVTLAKTILTTWAYGNDDEEQSEESRAADNTNKYEKRITDLTAEKNWREFGYTEQRDENVQDDPRFIHFDITVTHAATRSKVATKKTHLHQVAGKGAEETKDSKYRAGRVTEAFMATFTPVAFETTGSMGPQTKHLFETKFEKFGLHPYTHTSYHMYLKWYLKRVSIICSQYNYAVYAKFTNDVMQLA
jgi:hypothetical protein